MNKLIINNNNKWINWIKIIDSGVVWWEIIIN